MKKEEEGGEERRKGRRRRRSRRIRRRKDEKKEEEESKIQIRQETCSRHNANQGMVENLIIIITKIRFFSCLPPSTFKFLVHSLPQQQLQVRSRKTTL